MVLDWLAKGKTAGLPELLARKQFAKAVELAQAQYRARPGDGRLRLQLADTLIAAGRGREAVPLLREMADELATEGFAAKAIALLKRIQKIDPGRIDIEKRLASLIAQRTRQESTGRTQNLPVVSGLPELGMEEIGGEEIGFGAPPPAEPVPGGQEELLAGLSPAAEDAAAIGDFALDLEEGEAPSRPAPALFPDFSNEELVAVMAGLRLVTFQPGEIVVAEGEPGDSLFLLTTGTVKAWIRNPEGRPVLARCMGEGDFFGEISVLSGSPRTATIVAASACEMLELDRVTLDGITAQHPRVREVLQRFYEQRIANVPDGAPGGA